MNEMYNMSIDIHYYGVMMMVMMIVANGYHIKTVADIKSYRRKVRFVIPITYTILSLVLFTGTIMMAAKHLDFTIENIVMIFFGLLTIILEIKRHKPLPFINPAKPELFEAYKTKAMKILLFELVATLLITVWMSM